MRKRVCCIYGDRNENRVYLIEKDLFYLILFLGVQGIIIFYIHLMGMQIRDDGSITGLKYMMLFMQVGVYLFQLFRGSEFIRSGLLYACFEECFQSGNTDHIELIKVRTVNCQEL